MLDELIEKSKLDKDSLTYQEKIILKQYQIKRARTNFKDFCIYIRYAQNYKWAWFHKYSMERLNAKVESPNDRRLRLRMADQHGKTELIILLIAYLLGKRPNDRTLYVTYSDDRAKTPAGDLLQILISDRYKEIFPEFKLADELEEGTRIALRRREKLGALHFTNVNSPLSGHKGSFTATGIEGSVLGNSYDNIILDDLFNQVDVLSQVTRDKRWSIFHSSILSRQQLETLMVMIGTWWDIDDCFGRMNTAWEEADRTGTPYIKWEDIVFNALKDEREYPYDHRQIGEYLWPEFKMNYYMDTQLYAPEEWLIKAQNIPVQQQSKIFEPQDFMWYTQIPQYNSVVISIDPNGGKAGKITDDCAIMVNTIIGTKIYLLKGIGLNEINVKTQAECVARLIKDEYPNYEMVIIENSANGESLKNELISLGVFKIQLFTPKSLRNENLKGGSNGKRERAFSTQNYYKYGQVYFPHESIDVSIRKIYKQFINFTGNPGRKDDFVDAQTQFIIWACPQLSPIVLDKAIYNIPTQVDIPSINAIYKPQTNSQKLNPNNKKLRRIFT